MMTEITVEEYRVLFNAVTDAIRQIDDLREKLVEAQQKAEEIIISREDYGKITMLDPGKESKAECVPKPPQNH